ncbi:Concanavalin A-like lectin/glucanases superfamily protein [Halorubrum aquaticum]|uniref:Concanavalin A-like lectin/glucanases superfamily protein n=1 Tax=Halorubrum aquaticum TaxID=387340 RepID=A0A1I3AKK8_9EURY|nr:LamG-like jellyroll fold domain-containing protein [Halorubrum aquaticum]SFH50564.1 Concanavalin A-like lectin/glucanases superfamily protein [Halorubrum aquaticum]
MKRRKLLFSIGTVAGTGGIVGTGAFTSVSADRDVTVAVADDASGYLGLAPSGGPNGTFATTTADDTLALDFSSTTAGGDGLGTDSIYDFDDVFEVTNQGTQPIYVWATFAGGAGGFQAGGTDTDVWLYPNGDSGDKLRDSDDDALYLGVGKSANVGVHVDTDDLDEDQALTMTVNADVANPAGGNVVDGSGTTIPGPTDGLVSYWPLDSVGTGTVKDVTGSNDGTPNGVSATTGQVDNAASFDGDNDYVEVPDDPSLDLTDTLSLVAWVRPASSQDDYARIISREQSGAGNRQYNLGLDPSATKPRTVVDTASSNGVEVSGTIPIADDSWHHVAMTFDRNDAVRLYVDGVEAANTSVSDSLVSRPSPVVLGSPAHLPGKDLFTGRIDDARVYDRVLSAQEVTDLYDTTK